MSASRPHILRPTRAAGLIAAVGAFALAAEPLPLATNAVASQGQGAAPSPTPSPSRTETKNGGPIEGQIFDQAGLPLARTRLDLVGLYGVSRLPFVESKPPVERVLGKTVSDRNGFFALDIPDGTRPDRFLVRVPSESDWDRLRYAPVEDVDVTRDLKDRRHAVVILRVADAHGWLELQREMQRVGPDSARGHLLRQRGFPLESTQLEGGRVEWRYPDARYLFDADGKQLEPRDARGGA